MAPRERPPLRARARAVLSHRAWTIAAFSCFVLTALGMLYFDLLVALNVDCPTYNSRLNASVDWLGAAAFYLSVPLLAFSILRGILIRSRVVALFSVGFVIAGVLLLAFTVNHTMLYCALEGLEISPCLLGCAH